jgi:two-component system sensor histidine kinase and response regulator WspE
MTVHDLSQLSMLDLFRAEAENQVQALIAGLLALEGSPTSGAQLEACMRAAHSLKGAARIIDLAPGVDLAHAMEDYFVAAQRGRIVLRQDDIDMLLGGVDLLASLAATQEAELERWTAERSPDIAAFTMALQRTREKDACERAADDVVAPVEELAVSPATPEPAPRDLESADRVIRVSAGHLDRLLGLAGESLMSSRRLKPFSAALQRLKRLQDQSFKAIDDLHEALSRQAPYDAPTEAAAEVHRLMIECQHLLTQRLAEFELFEHRSILLAERLYDEALACRMRPFADGARRYPRIVRDLGRALGKRVKLEIVGASTQVDRDILEKLDAPLGHLLRNAVDHGIEGLEDRLAAGKPAEGTVRLEARHSAGRLQILVSDDGRGIDLDRLREAVVARKLSNAETAARLSESELLDFLFLPGFTLKDRVTEISGRGVGLDVVKNMVKAVRGVAHATARPDGGAQFQLEVPLSLSVVRALLVEIGGEPYAFPLAGAVRALKLGAEQVRLLQGRQHFAFEGRQVGLASAYQILEGAAPKFVDGVLSVVVIGDQHERYGLVVDRFLGERELVVQPLDARLGKIKDISAAALMDGAPVLILDIEDMLRSVEKLTASGRLSKVEQAPADGAESGRKRILVVDDSLTVRELERKLLDRHGYEVEVAVDGMDGWNAVRTGQFDLVVTDVDMPRMDGIELLQLIRKDPNLKSSPVMIVSYKDREEDRQRGLDAGADYYLTKSSFHDETLVQAVVDLIGGAEP